MGVVGGLCDSTRGDGQRRTHSVESGPPWAVGSHGSEQAAVQARRVVATQGRQAGKGERRLEVGARIVRTTSREGRLGGLGSPRGGSETRDKGGHRDPRDDGERGGARQMRVPRGGGRTRAIEGGDAGVLPRGQETHATGIAVVALPVAADELEAVLAQSLEAPLPHVVHVAVPAQGVARDLRHIGKG